MGLINLLIRETNRIGVLFLSTLWNASEKLEQTFALKKCHELHAKMNASYKARADSDLPLFLIMNDPGFEGSENNLHKHFEKLGNDNPVFFS